MVKPSLYNFCICVKIIEASDLPHPNISSLACVQVGVSKKYTKSIKHTDKPRFNEYFVFDLQKDFMELLSTVITISLHEPMMAFKVRKLIGSMSMEVSTIWALEGRRMKRWVVVNLPSDVTAVHTGFVNCDISVEASERLTRIPLLTPVDMPNVIGGTTGRYMVRIYRCIGLDTDWYSDNKQAPEVWVRVCYAGRSESTTKRKLRENPEWNEQITFIELVPPLYQKITVELIINKRVLALKDFYLYRISHVAKKDGFYPTYGPTYVHLYDNELLYQASLLMAIETEHLTLYKYKEKLHAVLRNPTQPAYENQLRKMETFLLFGVVFDAVLVEGQQVKRPVHVEISFGKQLAKRTLNNNTATRPRHALRESSGYQYLPINEEKPCLFLQSEWPDTRHRLSNCNIVARLADYLRERVDYAQNLQTRGSTKDAEAMLKMALQHIKTECAATLDHFTMGVTTLDFESVKLMIKHITQLASTVVVETHIEPLIEKSNMFLSTLDLMSEGMQDSLPYVLLSILEDKTAVGFCRVHPRQIIFSHSDIKKGASAGKIMSIFLNNEDLSYVGQINVWLWLGLWSDVADCLRSLPPGHGDITKSVTLPVSLSYDTDYKYAAICHILRGTIRAKSHEDLCDPFVSVLLSRHSKQTKKVKKTLTPHWKETLILTDVQLYPTPQFLVKNPPSLTIELWDGSGRLPRLLGTAMIKPKVRLQPFRAKLEYSFQWYTIGRSQILAFFEIIQLSGSTTDENVGIRRLSNILPEFLDPPMVTHRLEIVFWGIRANDTNGLKSIVQPQAVIQCGPVEIKSEFVIRANKAFNFKHDLHVVKLELPQARLYTPPLTVRLMTSAKYFGTNIENNVNKFLYNPPSEKQWRNCTAHRNSVVDRSRSRHVSAYESMPDLIPLLEQPSAPHSSQADLRQYKLGGKFKPIVAAVNKVINSLKMLSIRRNDKLYSADHSFEVDDEELDWWVRYYLKEVKVYRTQLEDVAGFDQFNDVLTTFPVKQDNQEGKEIIANVKVMICLYKWPVNASVVTKQGQGLEKGVLKYTELSERVKLLVRVYCIKANDLHPADPNGSADPFLEIATQSNSVSDEDHYMSQQLNPVFGRCLEIRVDFPVDTLLSVRVKDYDRVSSHDLIGETVIDLENRFYSKHRATCGLPSSYSAGGYDSWRDVETPVFILEKLCNSHNLPLPQYYDKSVVVASKEFSIADKMKNEKETQEQMALQVLRRWSEVPIVGLRLVPEHIETRSIYNNVKRPGIEQGTLEMWVDMFDLSLGEVPPPIDISPRKPQPYELRLIVWNTAKIPLVDDTFLVGKKHSDIFVKSWLWDSSCSQSTDVHYRCVNGNGNFNWRFVFPFSYLRAEKRMVIYKKTVLEIQQSEHKVPAIVSVQVWDKDRLSTNDFIGSLELELCRMPRGARSVYSCSVQISEDESKRVDLFKVKHMKGWWPFTKVKDGTRSSAGFLEAEFSLCNADEAAAVPVGLGRSEPSALSPPLRPEFKVKFWMAPFRILYYILCSFNKGKVLLFLLVVAVAIFIIVGVYSIPMFVIKRIIGA